MYPRGIAVDGSGNVYVSDRDNPRIQKFTSEGQFISQWGVLAVVTDNSVVLTDRSGRQRQCLCG